MTVATAPLHRRSFIAQRRVGYLLGLMFIASALLSCGIPDDKGPREIDPALLENITDQS
ncbi:MAG: hypothetical protein RLZZ254_853 [Actinomycetota bacterium]